MFEGNSNQERLDVNWESREINQSFLSSLYQLGLLGSRGPFVKFNWFSNLLSTSFFALVNWLLLKSFVDRHVYKIMFYLLKFLLDSPLIFIWSHTNFPGFQSLISKFKTLLDFSNFLVIFHHFHSLLKSRVYRCCFVWFVIHVFYIWLYKTFKCNSWIKSFNE